MVQRISNHSSKPVHPGLSLFIPILIILPAWILVSCYSTIERQSYWFSEAESVSDSRAYRDDVPDMPVSHRLMIPATSSPGISGWASRVSRPLPENLKPAVGAFPHRIIIADAATAKCDTAFFHFPLELMIKSRHSVQDCGQGSFAAFGTALRFFSTFNPGGFSAHCVDPCHSEEYFRRPLCTNVNGSLSKSTQLSFRQSNFYSVLKPARLVRARWNLT